MKVKVKYTEEQSIRKAEEYRKIANRVLSKYGGSTGDYQYLKYSEKADFIEKNHYEFY